jgi:hypothetical protein
MASYRPVSNLPFLAKLVERAVARRISGHLQMTGHIDPLQFAYKKHHSCESAMLTVFDTVLTAADNGEITLLILLDLTAAFDTISHSLLIDSLSKAGLEDDALAWFSNYLSERSTSIDCNGSRSLPSPLIHGVPQGSVLGPLLFTFYILGIGDIFQRHSIRYVLYADDIQIFLTTPAAGIGNALVRLQSCISEITTWLVSKHLVLNPAKTELLVLGTRQQLKKLQPVVLTIGNVEVSQKLQVKSLGLLIDSTLSMDGHIDSTCRSALSYLKAVSRQRQFLDDMGAQALIHSLVLSRLDYCASTLYGVTKKNITKLQRILNYSIRVAKKISSSELVPAALKDAGWLRAEQRINYKVACITHSVLSSSCPDSLVNLLHLQQPSTHSTQTRRSKDPFILCTERTSSLTGSRAFRASAPAVWNDLPFDIRQLCRARLFKVKLSEHLL